MPEPHILIVDDEPNVVRLCQRVLKSEGYEVLTSTSTTQALEVVSHQPVDVILVDLRMPGMDGFQLVEQARRNRPDMTALLMTGYGTLDTAIHALQRGMDGLILKPFDTETLKNSVRQAYQESLQKRDAVRSGALRPLFELSQALFSETVPDRLLELIVETTCNHMHCASAGYYQRAEGSPSWVLKSSAGGNLPFAFDPTSGDVVGQAMDRGEALRVNRDGPGDEQLQAFLVENGFSTLLCVPASHPAKHSYLLAARQAGDSFFREVDLEMLLILAGQAFAALENARLYAELRESLHQLEKSQHAMVQAEKMVSAARLTASIAHEINNPLQSLNNCLHLAGRRELTAADRQKFLTMAQTELDRLMSTVQRMLDFYRPGARDKQLSNVNKLIERVVDLVDQQMRKCKITVNTALAPDLPLVMIVSSQIQQVLINLVINAMEAMPGGGEIIIETHPLPRRELFGAKERPIDEENEPPGVEILVSDTGPGIPLEERERVFEPFYSTKENGTGLGLSVTYGIITAHSGGISLVDVAGRGACFRITLPEDKKR